RTRAATRGSPTAPRASRSRAGAPRPGGARRALERLPLPGRSGACPPERLSSSSPSALSWAAPLPPRPRRPLPRRPGPHPPPPLPPPLGGPPAPPARPAPAPPRAPAPPAAERRPVSSEYFGTKVTEDYRWLEDWADPAVQRWSQAENAFTRAHLDGITARGKL